LVSIYSFNKSFAVTGTADGSLYIWSGNITNTHIKD